MKQVCINCDKQMEKIQLLDIAKRHKHKSMHKCKKCSTIYVVDENDQLVDTKMSTSDYEQEKSVDDMYK